MALQRNGSDSMPQCKGSLRSRHPTSRLMPTIYMYIYKKKRKNVASKGAMSHGFWLCLRLCRDKDDMGDPDGWFGVFSISCRNGVDTTGYLSDISQGATRQSRV